MIDTKQKPVRIIVILAIVVAAVDIIYAVVFQIIDFHSELLFSNLVMLAVFWLPLVLFSYFLVKGRDLPLLS